MRVAFFIEYWENHFKCRYPGTQETPYNNYTNACTRKEIMKEEDTTFEAQLQFVSDAVLAFAYAFK